MLKTLSAVAVAIFLTACAGRQPQLVQVVQATDQQLACDQIVAEIKANNERIQDLAREEGWKVTQNVAAGVAGVFIPVLWFGMDFQDAAGKEGKALSQRNEYLASVAKTKCQSQVTTASVATKRS